MSNPFTTLKPLRTQYFFDLSGQRYKSQSDIIKMRNQWDLFEKVENYNDIVLQLINTGDRSYIYYQFKLGEHLDYKRGQTLHLIRYPNLPPTTFNSISESIITIPNNGWLNSPPDIVHIPKHAAQPIPIT